MVTGTIQANGARNALAATIQTSASLKLTTLQEYKELAEVLVKSNFCPNAKDVNQATYIMLYGAELGLPPIASLKSVYLQRNQPTLLAGAMATLIKKSGRYNYKVTKHTNDVSEIEVFENGESVGLWSFSIEDAKRAQLTTGPNASNYQKYPRNMLFSRNISNIAKQACSDVFGGAPVYIPEEFDMLVDPETGAPIDDTKVNISGAMHRGAAEEHAIREEMAAKEAAAAAKAASESTASASTSASAEPKKSSAGGKNKSAPATTASATKEATKQESATPTTPPPAEQKSSEDGAQSTTTSLPAGEAGEKLLAKAYKAAGVPAAEIAAFMKENFEVTKEKKAQNFTWECVRATMAFIQERADENGTSQLLKDAGIDMNEVPF